MKKITGVILTIMLLLLTVNLTAKDYSVVNKSGVIVTSITITISGSGSWNQVYSSSLQKGSKVTVDIPEQGDNCSIELKFTDDKGREYSMSDISLCGNNEIVLNASRPVEADKVIIHPKNK